MSSHDDDGAIFFFMLIFISVIFPWIIVDIINKTIEQVIVVEAQELVGLILVSLYVMITWLIASIIIIWKMA